MQYPAREPTFLPLTIGAANAAVGSVADTTGRASARAIKRAADEANSAAADCWTALLAGCESPGRRALPSCLRALSEATSVYAGTRWWLGDGSVHRRRVTEAEVRIDEAARDGDGEEFAEAFIGYDQAVATVLVAARSRLGSATA